MTRAKATMLFLLLIPVLACGCGTPITVHKVVRPAQLGGRTPLGFVSTGEGGIVIRTSNNLFEVDAGKFLISGAAGPFTASMMIGHTPAVLIDRALYAVESGGLEKLLEVPLENIVMAGGREFAYISGATPADRALLFIYSREQGNQPVLELPSPINALTVSADRVYFAAGAGIFTFQPGEEVIAIAMLPGLGRISALAVDPVTDIIYLSTGEAVHAILPDQGKIVLLFRDAATAIGWHEGGLYLLRSKDNTLYRVEGLSAALSSRSPPILELK